MIRNFIHAVWDRWVNIHPLLRFLILLLAVAGIGVCAFGPLGNPARNMIRGWRKNSNVKAGNQALKDKRMDEAFDRALTALRVDPSCLEAFRILEKSTAALRDPRHGDIARALLSHPEGSDDDRLNAFLSLAPEVPLGQLGMAWTTLTPECRLDPRFATAFADRLIADHRFPEAASVLLAVPPAAHNAAVNRRFIRILIGSGKREGFDEAQRLITKGFPKDHTERADWFDLLESIPPISLQPNLLAPVRSILENPESGDPARMALMLARLDYAGEPSRRAELLDEVINRWQDKEPVALARFLSDLGLYQRLLDTIPVERVTGHPDLFPLLLGAMERSGAWDQVIPLLDEHGKSDHPGTSLPKYEELAYRAVAAAKTGDSPGQVQGWTAAMREAKAFPLCTAFLKLRRIAEEAAMTAESEQAMVEAIHLGRGPLPLYTDLKPLLNSLAGQGRESTLLEICTVYLSLEPGNPELLTKYAYLACLGGRDEPKTIIKAMEVLAKGLPKELPIQCVLAAVYLCDNHPAKAAEIFDRLEIDPSKLMPGFRAAYLTTQTLNGRIPKDDPRITDFPWKSVLPSERKKFNELIQSVKP